MLVLQEQILKNTIIDYALQFQKHVYFKDIFNAIKYNKKQIGEFLKNNNIMNQFVYSKIEYKKHTKNCFI